MIIEDLVENAIGGGIGGKTVGVVGHTMDLECYAIGTPTPTITWTRDNQVHETVQGLSTESCILSMVKFLCTYILCSNVKYHKKYLLTC